MQVFEHSPLELPIFLLCKIFPFLDVYYKKTYNSHDAYEHFFVGFMSVLLACILMPFIGWKWSGLFILSAWVLHYVVKEVLVDGWNKHWIKKYIRKIYVDSGMMVNFAADTVTRNAGFIFGLPIFILTIWRLK